MRVGDDLYVLCLGERYLGVKYRVRHGVARLYHRIDGGQVLIQKVEIVLYRLPIARRGIGLHRLDMVAVVVPPAAYLAVHIVYLAVVRLYQLLLVGGYFFI